MSKSRSKQKPKAAAAKAIETVEATPPAVEELALPKRDDRFWTVAAIILVVTIVLRQWRLGEPSFHPDEAIHAFFSQGFATYHYDPTYHGPLLYHLVAGTIACIGTLLHLLGQQAPQGDVVALGTNGFTVRLVPSVLGIALVWMVLVPMRRWMGNRGALCSAALIAISPAIVAYSRRLLHDSLVLFLTLGAVACFLTALENDASSVKGRSARVGLIAFLTLFLATKANCFFVIVMLGAYWFAWRVGPRLDLGYGNWLAVALWFLVPLFSIIIPNYTNKAFVLVGAAACGWMGFWLMFRPEARITESFEGDTQGRLKGAMVSYALAVGVGLWIYVFLFGQITQFLQHGLVDRRIPWETLPHVGQEARSAIPRMLHYWGGQQATPRLPGRHDYYFVLILLYEVPILLAGIGGIWHAARNRSQFSDLLMWWAFTSWTVYAVANEKVPWLTVHILLPLALLGGYWLGKTVKPRQPGWIIAGVVGAAFSLRGVSAVSFERAGDNAEPMFYAHTPEHFQDALESGLKDSLNDGRIVWMHDERQWPTFWYLRRGAPYMGTSSYSYGKVPDPALYRLAVSRENEWPKFVDEGFTAVDKKPISFLIWPRASWEALAPQRYWPWFLSRQTIPAGERGRSQTEWKQSILSGHGEWSEATAIVGVREHLPGLPPPVIWVNPRSKKP